MRITCKGHNVEITESMKAFVEDKAKGLEKYVEDGALGVTAEVIKGEKKASMILSSKGKTYVVSSESTDFYDAVLSSLDKLKKQLSEDKNKREARKYVILEMEKEEEEDNCEEDEGDDSGIVITPDDIPF